MNPQHEALKKFGYQINYAIENYSNHGLSANQFSNILIGGLGGSGIGGRIVKTIFMDEFPIPVEVIADYHLPAYVNEKTLVILGSYSGNTEETLAMFEEVKAKGSQMIILTGGGKLAALAKENNLKTYLIEQGFQPRMALGFSLTYLVQIFADLMGKEIKGELKSIVDLFEDNTPYHEEAEQVFNAIESKAKYKFVVLSDAQFEAVATRFAQQVQENAKHECFTHVLPEHNHNVIESYYGTLDTVFFFLNSNSNPRVVSRFDFLTGLLEVENHKIIELGVEQFTLASVYQTIHRLDWISLLVADYRRVDSLNVPNIASLKEFFRKRIVWEFSIKYLALRRKRKTHSGPFANPVQVEFHSHLIFGVDDGCEHIEQSIELLKGFAALGMKKVIATPHVMSDFYKNNKENIYPLRDQIRERLKEENIPIEFEAAAEYMIDDGFEKKIAAGNLLTFGNEGKHILVELPFMTEPPNLGTCLFEMQIAGYKPILAHPERYLYYANEKEKYHELKDRGILFQLNMLSGIGYYSKPVAEAAQYLVQNKMIDMVGSDTHHIRHMQLLPEAINSKVYRKVCEAELLNNYL